MRELNAKEAEFRRAMLDGFKTLSTTIRPSDIFIARGGPVDPEDYGFLASVAVGHSARAVNHGVLVPVERNGYLLGYNYANDSEADAKFLEFA